MTLKEQIDHDFIESYKGNETEVVSVLRMLRSAIKNTEINEKKTLDESEILKIIKKEAKQRVDSISEYKKADRIDLAIKEESELKILQKYLPAQISIEEITKIVDETIAQTGAQSINDLGKVMGAALSKLKEQADGAVVAKIVRERLQK